MADLHIIGPPVFVYRSYVTERIAEAEPDNAERKRVEQDITFGIEIAARLQNLELIPPVTIVYEQEVGYEPLPGETIEAQQLRHERHVRYAVATAPYKRINS